MLTDIQLKKNIDKLKEYDKIITDKNIDTNLIFQYNYKKGKLVNVLVSHKDIITLDE
jgi:hypothetical protein